MTNFFYRGMHSIGTNGGHLMTVNNFIEKFYERGISLNEVQRRANLGSSFFWRWRNGKITPRASTIARIKAVLETPDS